MVGLFGLAAAAILRRRRKKKGEAVEAG